MKREMIAELSKEYSVKQACGVLGLARSSYYRKKQEKAGDEELLEEIERIIMRWPYYGYRRISKQ